MYAVVDIAGNQYQVTNNQTITVDKLSAKPGEEVTFDNVLVANDGSNTTIGSPFTGGAVKAKVIEHGRADKVLVFHKKRRKGYRKLNGHRQHYTTIEITSVA
jgi:large subunit ribosomal protein L21